MLEITQKHSLPRKKKVLGGGVKGVAGDCSIMTIGIAACEISNGWKE